MKAPMLLAGIIVAAPLAFCISLQGQAAAPAQAEARAAARPSGNADNGKKLFVANGCWECHGYEGQGSVSGPRLAPQPIAMAALIRYVRAPLGEMPPYTSKVVSDSDLADIYAFLQSRPRPAAVSTIPLLQ